MDPGLRRDDGGEMGKAMTTHKKIQANPQSGSALIYILIAIALLAALTVSFMQPSGNQTQTQNAFKAVSELQSQIDFIRSAVHECVLSHPGGDVTINNAGGGTDPGADRRYPINPGSTHFTGATVGPKTAPETRWARHIRCPGNPGDDQNHATIFGGATGKFLPPPPSLFEEWQWYNGTDGVFFWIASARSDAFIDSAYQKLSEGLATCEFNIVNGSANLDAAGTTSCAAGQKCFRVWMIRKTACP